LGQTGDTETALELYAIALRMAERRYGEDAAKSAAVKREDAELLRQAGRSTEAAEMEAGGAAIRAIDVTAPGH
jgi:hypothetical protein